MFSAGRRAGHRAAHRQPITSTFFTSIGKAKKGMFLSLTRQILFLLPLIVILPRLFGIEGILYAGPSADLAAAIAAIILAYIEFKDMDKKAGLTLEKTVL